MSFTFPLITESFSGAGLDYPPNSQMVSNSHQWPYRGSSDAATSFNCIVPDPYPTIARSFHCFNLRFRKNTLSYQLGNTSIRIVITSYEGRKIIDLFFTNSFENSCGIFLNGPAKFSGLNIGVPNYIGTYDINIVGNENAGTFEVFLNGVSVGTNAMGLGLAYLDTQISESFSNIGPDFDDGIPTVTLNDWKYYAIADGEPPPFPGFISDNKQKNIIPLVNFKFQNMMTNLKRK